MHGDQHPSKVALREAREATIEQLSDRFSRDELSLEEFEQRVDQAYAAATADEAQALVRDLTVAPTTPVRVAEQAETAPAAAMVVAEQPQALTRREQDWLALAIFGNIERHGRFAVVPGSRALAAFGNIELDLRSVSFPPGVTEIEVQAIFGNVELIVPPTLFVECHGVSIFGNFENLGRIPMHDEGGPVLRIRGKAIFGNVELATIPSGASRSEARLARYKR